MAERSSVAFGRYLKMLRERRGLSLDAIYARSQSFPEPLMKGYLSRVENGHQKLAFPKMIPLSRILEVPSEVLVERMELDLELDKVGGPETEGMKFKELLDAGNDALRTGHTWNSYGYFRESVWRAPLDSVLPAYRDSHEQVAMAIMAVCSPARRAGRVSFAHFELTYLKRSGSLGSDTKPFLYRELSFAYSDLGEAEKAKDAMNDALALLENCSRDDVKAAVYSARAIHAAARSEWDAAISDYQRAYDVYTELGWPLDRARVLNNIAQSYLSAGNLRAARRIVESAANLMGDRRDQTPYANSQYLLGEIALADNNLEAARHHLTTASTTARDLNDKVLRFKTDFLLLKVALKSNNRRSARVLKGRLTKLSAWVPQQIPELKEFELLSSE